MTAGDATATAETGRDRAVGGGSDDTVRRSLAALAFRPVWAVLTATIALFLALPGVPLEYRLAPLAVSIVLLGLPHGAVDHLAVPRARGDSPTPRSMALIGLLYLGVGAAYAALWFLAPAAAFALFIAITWAHWGQGDVYALLALTDAGHLRATWRKVLTAATRGAFPMLVPLVAFPEEYRLVAEALTGLFAPGAVDALAPAFTPAGRAAAGGVVAALVLATLVTGYRNAVATDSRRAWRIDAVETLLLVAFFLAVPPLFAVGLYFCIWHALRHVLRLVLVDDRAVAAVERGDLVGAFGRFARDAAPLTAASIALLAGFYALVPHPPGDGLEWVGLYLVFVAVVTLPHVLVVAWMDLVEGVWSGGDGRSG